MPAIYTLLLLNELTNEACLIRDATNESLYRRLKRWADIKSTTL